VNTRHLRNGALVGLTVTAVVTGTATHLSAEEEEGGAGCSIRVFGGSQENCQDAFGTKYAACHSASLWLEPCSATACFYPANQDVGGCTYDSGHQHWHSAAFTCVACT
jgi:hypothetical protein